MHLPQTNIFTADLYSANLILVFHLFILGYTSFVLPTLLQSYLVNIIQEYKGDLVVGIFFIINFCFSSLWTEVVGYVIDTYSSFTLGFILMGILGLIGFVIFADQMRRL